MSPTTFEQLHSRIAPCISKSSLRRPVPSSSERLCITMRYLVTGDAQVTISTSYMISPTKVGRIIKETCEAIWEILKQKGFLKAPSCKAEWLEVADVFQKHWNFPHCLGAIDVKHIVIQEPARSG